MSTLRERLVALARSHRLALTINRDEMVDVSWSTRESLALAAARLALEDAREKCDYNRYVNAKSQGPWTEGIRDGMTQASLAIRSLRDGLD